MPTALGSEEGSIDRGVSGSKSESRPRKFQGENGEERWGLLCGVEEPPICYSGRAVVRKYVSVCMFPPFLAATPLDNTTLTG